jgi:hypothetical protein
MATHLCRAFRVGDVNRSVVRQLTRVTIPLKSVPRPASPFLWAASSLFACCADQSDAALKVEAPIEPVA